MDSLCPDVVRLLIEDHLEVDDALALFCVSKKFNSYGNQYRKLFLDARKGWNHCIQSGKLMAAKLLYRRRRLSIKNVTIYGLLWSLEYGHVDVARWLYQLSIKNNYSYG